MPISNSYRNPILLFPNYYFAEPIKPVAIQRRYDKMN